MGSHYWQDSNFFNQPPAEASAPGQLDGHPPTVGARGGCDVFSQMRDAHMLSLKNVRLSKIVLYFSLSESCFIN